MPAHVLTHKLADRRGHAARRSGAAFTGMLADANVRIDGDRPWDLRVLDDRVFDQVARRGLTGLGDAYVKGWWECAALDQLFERMLQVGVPGRLPRHPSVLLRVLLARLVNAQSHAWAFRNGRAHYNLGNDLFRTMLGPRMVYSCAYWKDARNLDEAQEAKLDLVCRKLDLRPGMRLLDVGCGWGGLVRYAAENYDVRAVGVTVSEDQAGFAQEHCRELDVEIRLQDYRDLSEQFDRIVSVGMFEHVGPRNYRTFMRTVRRCLAEDGLFLLHTIATRDRLPTPARSELDWIERNIFPGAVLPSMEQIGAAVDGIAVTEDVENFGADYDPTLMAWHANFEAGWPELASRYGERFRRMWRYYLLSCAGAFRSRAYQVWQFVLSPRGVPGGYRRPGAAGTVPTGAGRSHLQLGLPAGSGPTAPAQARF